ncbi:MAG: hypothetical protein HKP61_05670 [Dactylosporangium sp.]|nr:hypothetical protein [Dactylosporangium sp.]NNJ60435.1 hypothetical protein [Dactylosporangium sp.]
MAVRLDVDTVRGIVDPPVFRGAEELLGSGMVGEISTVGGGCAAVVLDGGERRSAWVGVTDGTLATECDCEPEDAEELCVHVVAVALSAIQADFAWSSAATSPKAAVVDSRVRRLAEIAAELPLRRLAMLVAEHAVGDRRLEAKLLTHTGRIDQPTAVGATSCCDAPEKPESLLGREPA